MPAARSGTGLQPVSIPSPCTSLNLNSNPHNLFTTMARILLLLNLAGL